MKKFNLFNLYIIEFNGVRYICVKDLKTSKYKEIFASININEETITNVEPLSQCYEILVIKSCLSGKLPYLTKEELLLKFLEINFFNIYRKNHINDVDNIIKQRKEYLKLFKELSLKYPEKAKEIARKKLENSGILDKQGNITTPYTDALENRNNTKKLKKEIKK